VHGQQVNDQPLCRVDSDLFERPFESGGVRSPAPVLFLLLRGEVNFDFGRTAVVGEGRIPALEVAGQVVVQRGGTDLEEELGARW